jgi:hypothetical protein
LKKLLKFTSVLETLLGVFLIIDPSLVLKSLFNMDSTASIIALSRLTGIVYFCFGIVCFPPNEISGNYNKSPVVRAMFLYNILAAIYLGYLKFVSGYDGRLLFPAVILHVLITLCFVYMIFVSKKDITAE